MTTATPRYDTEQVDSSSQLDSHHVDARELSDTKKLKVFIEKLIEWDNKQREREQMSLMLSEMLDQIHDEYRDDILV
jgi:hypothetical protein